MGRRPILRIAAAGVPKDKTRVTIIEPGTVATKLIQHITNPEVHDRVQKMHSELTTLQSRGIAAIVYAVTQPNRVNVNEILVRPTEQQN